MVGKVEEFLGPERRFLAPFPFAAAGDGVLSRIVESEAAELVVEGSLTERVARTSLVRFDFAIRMLGAVLFGSPGLLVLLVSLSGPHAKVSEVRFDPSKPRRDAR